MTPIHVALLTLEISSATIAGLVLIGVMLASIRALRGEIVPAWNEADIAAAEARVAAEGWLHRSLSAFDIAFNVIFLRGQQDETISTHSYRASLEGKLWGKLMCDWLDMLQPDHGLLATCGDFYRASVRAAALKKVLGLN
jgi:hypothetical protein